MWRKTFKGSIILFSFLNKPAYVLTRNCIQPNCSKIYKIESFVCWKKNLLILFVHVSLIIIFFSTNNCSACTIMYKRDSKQPRKSMWKKKMWRHEEHYRRKDKHFAVGFDFRTIFLYYFKECEIWEKICTENQKIRQYL